MLNRFKIVFSGIKNIPNILKKFLEKGQIDPLYIFPLLSCILGLLVFYFSHYNYGLTYWALLFFSLLHLLFLSKVPYVSKSAYYKYLSLYDKYVEENRVVKNFLTPVQKILTKYVMIASFLSMYKYANYYEFFFSVYAVSFSAFAYQNMIEVYVLIQLPRLPERVKLAHPLYVQKRFSPYWQHFFEKIGTKVLPICGRVTQVGLTGLGFISMGTKYIRGGEEMDFPRIAVVNYFHGLPQETHWSEGRLMFFQKFHRQCLVETPGISYAESYAKFVQQEEKFKRLYNLAQEVLEKTSDIRARTLEEMADSNKPSVSVGSSKPDK